MADAPQVDLTFDIFDCVDCGVRTARPLDLIPEVGDDFDWRARDYDAIRAFMLEELAARYPERTRWSPADIEVVVVEVLAAMLDQLSDMADRVAMEGMLETARRPESVRRLLEWIGFDPVRHALSEGLLEKELAARPRLDQEQALDRIWRDNPHAMEDARRAGPERIFDQARMVTLADYAVRLDDHPLVERAHAASQWNGAWSIIDVTVILADTRWSVDDTFACIPRPPSGDSSAIVQFERRIGRLRDEIDQFHIDRGLPLPARDQDPTFRSVLRTYLDAYRIAGQPVTLEDAVPVGIAIVVSLVLPPTYYRSEVRRAAEAVLGSGPEGFFRAGRLKFGEDLFASDLIAALMDVEGVENVCLIRFKRVGSRFPDHSSGHIELKGTEIAVCDNNRGALARGYYSLILNGGIVG
jgi:hypothetical protein